MDGADTQEEIRDLNLAYLMLAQRLLRDDRETAMFRLGIGAETAQRLETLTATQLVRVATSPMLVPRIRFDDPEILGLMAGDGRDSAASGIHAVILAANKAAGEHA